MSVQRLSPDREAEIREDVERARRSRYNHSPSDSQWSARAADLLAELDAVREALAAAEEPHVVEWSYNNDSWTVWAGGRTVECPDCGFSFDSGHTDDSPEGGYSCPACAQTRAEASLALVEGQAHRATQDVLALRRIATAAKEYKRLRSTAWPPLPGESEREGDARVNGYVRDALYRLDDALAEQKT